MRLFIAIDIPEEVKHQIDEIKSQIKIDGKANFMKTGCIHLTLKFLGEADPEEIKQKLSAVKFKQFELSTSELGFFPNEKRINIIWLGLNDKKSNLSQLKEQIDNSLPDFKDDHDFHAHLTIARVKFLNSKDELISSVKKIKFNPVSFKVEHIKLYKSTLTPEGPVYEELAVF